MSAKEKLDQARELIGEVYSEVHDEALEALLFNTIRPALDEARATVVLLEEERCEACGGTRKEPNDVESFAPCDRGRPEVVSCPSAFHAPTPADQGGDER